MKAQLLLNRVNPFGPFTFSYCFIRGTKPSTYSQGTRTA